MPATNRITTDMILKALQTRFGNGLQGWAWCIGRDAIEVATNNDPSVIIDGLELRQMVENEINGVGDHAIGLTGNDESGRGYLTRMEPGVTRQDVTIHRLRAALRTLGKTAVEIDAIANDRDSPNAA